MTSITDDDERPGRFSSSLCAGLSILTSFSAEHPVRGIADVADDLGMGRSTIHRYATTLTALGYLEQGSSRKYRLASRVADVGLALLDSMELRLQAREHLRELRTRTGYTVGLAVLDGGEALCIDQYRGHRRGQYEVDAGVGVGMRLPLHCTASGKALLAYLPDAELQELLASLRLTRRGPNAITSKKALLEELESVRAEGLAVDDEELAAGRRALAVPVLDDAGHALAAIVIAAPAEAFTRALMVEELGPQAAATAMRLAEDLAGAAKPRGRR